ncbi:hypothetical protein P0E61_14080 [Enterococcus faecalis]|uniref:hypothetical protein n=1 Tax=Enterococcus faecalis TaxID=1351 RepID=UPI0025B21A14|nr:hypothetical protein [Enterococcus faecalis]MDN3101462.1 hypothetical protein [Enterococcus faecalis]
MTIRYFEQYTSGWKREVDGSGVLDAWVNRRHWVGYGGSELPNESEKLERLNTAVGLIADAAGINLLEVLGDIGDFRVAGPGDLED